MKFRITMKDPDTLQDAIVEAVKADVKTLSLSGDEADAIVDLRCGAVAKLAQRWFEYGEYVTLELDTIAETCTVVAR
jgi:hypothetical protein